MKKTPTSIIILRYILVVGLLYAIWHGKTWAIQVTCTLCILHSEFLYVINRVQEAQVMQMAHRKIKEMEKDGTKAKS